MAENKGHFKKGHRGYYKGKKLDRKLFINGYEMWANRGITLEAYARLVNLTIETLKKDLNLLLVNGYLPEYLMKDGRRLVLEGYDGEFNKYGEEGEGEND